MTTARSIEDRTLPQTCSLERRIEIPRLPQERISALNDAEQDGNDGHHQEEVNESSERVRRGDAEQPQNDEDDDEC